MCTFIIKLSIFVEATPSDDEKALHDQVAEVLNKSPMILDRLRKYAGCEEFIRKVCDSAMRFVASL